MKAKARQLNEKDVRLINVGESNKSKIITLTKEACHIVKHGGVGHLQFTVGLGEQQQVITLVLISDEEYARKAHLAAQLNAQAKQSVEIEKEINAELNGPTGSKIIT